MVTLIQAAQQTLLSFTAGVQKPGCGLWLAILPYGLKAMVQIRVGTFLLGLLHILLL